MNNYITVYNLPVRKQSEFFIAVANQNTHSLMMSGVVLPDGRKQLLAKPITLMKILTRHVINSYFKESWVYLIDSK